MKRLFTLPTCGILLCFSFSSCDAPIGSIANPNTLDNLNRKSFEVTSYEMYDHDTQVSYDLARTNDHVYLTLVSLPRKKLFAILDGAIGISIFSINLRNSSLSS